MELSQRISTHVPNSRNILVVDDDADFAASLRALLVSRGYGAQIATSSDQALELLQARGFEVALVDVRLGQLSGIELIATLQRTVPALACVLITAHASLDSAVAAIQAGAYEYLRKPFAVDDLSTLR